MEGENPSGREPNDYQDVLANLDSEPLDVQLKTLQDINVELTELMDEGE